LNTDVTRRFAVVSVVAAAYAGNNFYSDSAMPPQNIQEVLPRSQTRRFEMRFQNDGTGPDRIEIDEANFQKGGNWEFKAKIGQNNVTNLLKGPGFYLTPKLEPGEAVKVKLTITNRNGNDGCECFVWQIDGGSRKSPSAVVDSVRVALDHEPL
jgi:hypothetical protein